MSLTLQEERPPFVIFTEMPVEDRDESVKAGRKVMKSVDIAYITPSGSKDRIPRIVADWFRDLAQQVDEQRYPQAWLQHHEANYEAWKKGQARVLNGTALATWPGIGPAQAQNCQAIGVLTVEDLASLNDEGIRRLGHGAQDLKMRARAFIEAARDGGRVSQEVTALQMQNEQLRLQNETMAQQLAELTTLVQKALPATPAEEEPAGQGEAMSHLDKIVSASIAEEANPFKPK